MKYNIDEEFLMKKDYNKLVKNETVRITHRDKKGKDTCLDVKNSNDEIFKGLSPKLLKKKK